MRSWFREWCLNLSCWVCLERHTACSGVSHQIKCLRRWQSCQGPRCPLRSLRICRWILTEKELLRFVGTKPTSSWKPNKFVNWTEVSAVQWARVIFSITTSWMNELHLCDSCDWICSMSMKYDIHDLQKGGLAVPSDPVVFFRGRIWRASEGLCPSRLRSSLRSFPKIGVPIIQNGTILVILVLKPMVLGRIPIVRLMFLSHFLPSC